MTPRTSLALLLALAILPGSVLSQEESAIPKPEDDWLQFYYQDPDPSRLVDEVKTWASDGTLENQHAVPVVIAFLSQVFRQNREEINDWYKNLSGLTTEEKAVIHTAMAFSRTTEANEIMKAAVGKDYEEQKEAFPKILEMKLAKPDSLGMLWGYFYATGSKSAVRRVIWAFRFDEAPINPDFAKVPKGHKPLYTRLPGAAYYTLTSNALEHSKVLDFCRDIFKNDKELTPPERRWLGKVLEEVESEQKAGAE